MSWKTKHLIAATVVALGAGTRLPAALPLIAWHNNSGSSVWLHADSRAECRGLVLIGESANPDKVVFLQDRGKGKGDATHLALKEWKSGQILYVGFQRDLKAAGARDTKGGALSQHLALSTSASGANALRLDLEGGPEGQAVMVQKLEWEQYPGASPYDLAVSKAMSANDAGDDLTLEVLTRTRPRR